MPQKRFSTHKNQSLFKIQKKPIPFCLLQNAHRIVFPLVRALTIKKESERFLGHFKAINFFCFSDSFFLPCGMVFDTM